MEMAWSAKEELSLVDASGDDDDVTVVDRWCRDEVDADGTVMKPLVVATAPKAAAMARELAERNFMMNEMDSRYWFDEDAMAMQLA